MTEPSPIEIQYSKDQATSQEVQKKKKSSKKKAEPKPVNPRIETVEGAIPNLHTEADFDLIHYTYKLEQQLATVKRQVKQQKQKFRQVIHGLAKYFDERGVSSQAIEEYVQNLGTQIAENQDRESDYEKFFTVHKYHIVEDPTTFGAKSLPKVGQKAENGPKSTPKEISTSVKLDTSEPTQADLTVSDKGDKPEKKKGRPSTKAANGNGTTAEEAPKKRKYTKHKQSDEGIINIAPDIQEIPPLEFPKKSENKVKKAEDAIRGYEEINQKPIDLSMMGQPTFGIDDGLKAVVKQMGIDPAALMNPYMAGAFGVQEGDIYNKLFQELMKASSPNPMLNTEKARQELFNYYQGNFK